MKLWEKGGSLSEEIEKFTVGQDRQLDLELAPYDVLGSLAHIAMLQDIGLLQAEEYQDLKAALLDIYEEIAGNRFVIEKNVEDVHSQIEILLTRKLGETGKKIHSGRSRNDQVLVDIKLYLRDQVKVITELTATFCEQLLVQSETFKKVIIPGYTHMQAAMPSSFGLWFGAYAESLVDDLRFMKAAFEVVDQNPLGSAAGYGNSFPLNRQLTTELLGFAQLHVNVVAAQMSRGKTEISMAYGVAALSNTLSRLAMDICLYNSQNFGFLSFPDHITTGSSIMPHKKNPDVFELIRSRCNLLQQLPSQLQSIGNNLPSGYHRDMQITKEVLLPALKNLKDCLTMASVTLNLVQVNPSIMEDPRYDLIYSVENVNQQVLQGVPFRDAYRLVAEDIARGTFKPSQALHHTHVGSIGNLGNDQIRGKLHQVLSGFDFESYEIALKNLVAG